MTPLLPSFRAIAVDSAAGDHWQGGEAAHPAAYCDRCDRPWILVWDLNAQDPRFTVSGRKVFGDLQRLPLYFCWCCEAQIAYQLVEDDVEPIEDIFLVEHRANSELNPAPYENYPLCYPRRALQLNSADEMSAELKAIVAAAQEEDDLEIPTEHRAALSEWYGHKVETVHDLWAHEVGGTPFRFQGHDERCCPNEECAVHDLGWPMHVLAAVKNDPLSDLPFIETKEMVAANRGHFNHFLQLVFYYCQGCDTIRVVVDND